MRKTQEGDLLIKLTKSNTSIYAASEIKKTIKVNMPNSKVVCFGPECGGINYRSRRHPDQ